MVREWVIEETVSVGADAKTVYAAIADLRRMGDWSPELFATWIRGRAIRPGTKFVGFNRIGWRLWFTTCQVTVAVPGEAFAFRVSTFGMPVALWGYRIEDVSDDPSAPRTRVTEYWEDLRRGSRTAPITSALGRTFTGVGPEQRSARNREGMRTTLDRIKAAVEKG